MEEHLLIAVIAALLNILFSILIPPLLSNSKLPFTDEVKKHYKCNKNFIIISTLLTIILVYVSLKITPFIKSHFFEKISELNKVYEIKIPQLPIQYQQPIVQQPIQYQQPIVQQPMQYQQPIVQ